MLISGRPPVIRSNGKLLRDYMYINDAVRTIMTLAEKPKKSKGNVFNLGTSKPTSVFKPATKVAVSYGSSLKPVLPGKNAAGEIDR